MSNEDKRTNCDMHEILVSYLYNEATAEESKLVEQHLNECAACKEELHSFERVRGMLQQWEIDDLPVVRVVAERPGSVRSMLPVLKELISVTPIWAKALGAVAMGLIVLAIIGTDINVGSGGFSFRADLLRRGRTLQATSVPSVASSSGSDIEQVRAEVKGLVNQLIAESERRQHDEIKAQLVSLESQLQTMRSADLTKLATRIQEQHARLKTIEQDIDRREGLDLTDILFSDVSRPGSRAATGGSD
ncbi:MAG TPA: zf-HC2 domain-containing protein [Blastocatellia bacterium]|nr:zf-HC2 domain-containing protein [Blastocatellia bacterium]